MANLVTAAPAIVAAYRGLEKIFQYVNDDGQHSYFNCGQAAAMTCLTHLGHFDPEPANASLCMREIEKQYPPDNLGGWAGSSRRCVTRICKSKGVRLQAIHGETALKKALDRCLPAIVMLGVPGDKFLGFEIPGGHWMVAFGYDPDYVYLSNIGGGYLPWDHFRKGWNALIPRLIQMRNTALVPVE